ncbi:hypothetical protein ACJQWK_11874 [Exserohilum turcicum]
MAGPAVSPRHALHGAITKGVKALPRPHAIADRRLLGRPYALCSHGFVEPRLQRRPSNLLSASLSLHAHRHLVSSHRWSVSVSVCRSRARYERPNRRSPHPHWRWRWRWLWLCCTAPSCRRLPVSALHSQVDMAFTIVDTLRMFPCRTCAQTRPQPRNITIKISAKRPRTVMTRTIYLTHTHTCLCRLVGVYRSFLTPTVPRECYSTLTNSRGLDLCL